MARHIQLLSIIWIITGVARGVARGVTSDWLIRQTAIESDLWLMFYLATNRTNNQVCRHVWDDSLPQQRVGRGCITDKVSTLNLLIIIYY